MKISSLKCRFVLSVLALLMWLGQSSQIQAQPSCGINFTGPAGNVLTSFVDLYPNYPNCNATFNTVVQNTNAPLPPGTYLTWCMDAGVEIDPSQGNTVSGTIYTGQLFATCDTNLNSELPPNHTATSYVSPATWQAVNYLLNHKAGTNFWAVQVAINTLVGGPAPSSPGYPAYDPAVVNAMLTDASNNAAYWTPQPGNVIGAAYVIQNQAGVTITNPVQLLIIEVPYCPVTITKCPPNLSLGCNPSVIPDGNLTNFAAVSSCGYPLNFTFTKSQASAGCATYRYIVYTASDAYGNTASCSQTISWTTDTAAPVLISAPTGGSLGYNPATLPADVSISNLVTYSETCSAAKVNVSHVDSGSACSAARTFSISASDACGNVSATNFVTYTYAIDTNAPVIISVPPSTNLGCTYVSLPTDATVATNIAATDNCSLASTNVTHVDSTNGAIVTRTFTVTVSDAAGNISAPGKVVYTWTIATGPTIVCASDITINGTNASPSVTGIPSVYDACGNPIICSNTVALTTNFWPLYNDQFSGPAGVLNGRAPDSADLAGLKWTASPNWLVNDGQAAITNSSANAFLPFQPGAGVLYQVSADVECVSGPNTSIGSDWVALGFANGFNTGPYWHTVNNPVGWQLIRNSGNTGACGQTFAGPGVAGGSNPGYFPTNITHYSIILDTRPASPSAWTFTYLVNGTVVTPPTVFGGSGPAITTVGFGTFSGGGAAGHVKNFTVAFGVTSLVTNGGACANLSYTDTVASSTCAGSLHIIRTWSAWDNQGHTNTCNQNIYETVPLAPVVFSAVTTNLGCAPATLPTDANVAALVVAYGGLSATNVYHVDSTNGCNITRTFTVTVKDSCGNTSPAATLAYNWVNAVPAIGCWVSGPASANCLSTIGYTCCVTNTGNAPFSSCLVTACGQTFTCPALNPGQGCAIPINYNCLVSDLGLFSCKAVASAVCATACAPTCTTQAVCQTTVVGQPSCKVTVSGPSSGLCLSPVTYWCNVTNNGTCPFSACTLNACGQYFGCPALQPGQGCSIPVTHTFQVSELGLFNCIATVGANCVNSTAPSCVAQSACATTVVGQPSCKVTVSGPSSGLCLSPVTYWCNVTNNGTCPFSACTLNACGQYFGCPALQPGQGCSIPVTHTFQVSELGLFNCIATVGANCVNSTAPSCVVQSACATSVVGQPSCKVTVSGPSTCSWFTPATYTCTVLNNGTCPLSACNLTACGKTFACPALSPGQSCNVTCTQSFSLANLLSGFTCQAVANCTATQSTAPTCSSLATCFTSLHN